PSTVVRTLADAPALSDLAVTPRTIRRASLGSGRRAGRPRISFTLSAAAGVQLRFDQAREGRTVGRSCVKPTRSNRAKRHCSRYVTAGSFTVHGKAGSNTVPFAGKLPGHKPLATGAYRLTGTATDGSGAAGQPRTTTLKIAKR